MSEFPAGIAPPVKVRIYRRRGHSVLQWWDRQAGRTLHERVDGDLLDALSRAREIDRKLLTAGTAGTIATRVTQSDLVEKYCRDLSIRADAGEISVATVKRFSGALQHFLAFSAEQGKGRSAQAAATDREFALRFMGWLTHRPVTRNGRKRGIGRPMVSSQYVIDVVRAMFEWARDPGRARLLPETFLNPFAHHTLNRRAAPADPLGEPDITVDMAAGLLEACDAYQLKLFAPMVFWGLRPGELVWMFRENATECFMRVDCIEALDHKTKGIRNKSLPWLDPLRRLLLPDESVGLLFLRRQVALANERPKLLGATIEHLATEYRTRLGRGGATMASTAAREAIRETVLRDAGAINYKRIEGEFLAVARKLGWTAKATLKDLRHLCQTTLDNGGLSREERQYILGQSMGRAALNAYVHLNKLSEHYHAAVEKEMRPLLEILKHRVDDVVTSA